MILLKKMLFSVMKQECVGVNFAKDFAGINKYPRIKLKFLYKTGVYGAERSIS